MLNLSASIRIFVCAAPTDMRKQFDGLSAIVTHTFGRDVMTGDYFVFINRRKNRCKVLCWDRDGFALWAKKLEPEGTQIFGLPEVRCGAYNRRPGLAETGRMVRKPLKSGSRRCLMRRQQRLSVPPRARAQRKSFDSTTSGHS